jgi:hemoglobin
VETMASRARSSSWLTFCARMRGGPVYYTGRDMKTSHQGMGIAEIDWTAFIGHLGATLDSFQVPRNEREAVVAFIQSTKPDIVET